MLLSRQPCFSICTPWHWRKSKLKASTYCSAKCYDQLLVRFELMARIGLRRCDEWIIEALWLWNFSLCHHGPNNLPNANFNLLRKLGPGNLGFHGLDIGLQQIGGGGNSILTLGPLANVDVYLPNGMTSCQTLQNSVSHYIIDGLQRPKCHHGFTFCGPLGPYFFHVPMGS